MKRLGRRAREELADAKGRRARANARLGALVQQHHRLTDEHHAKLLGAPGAIQPSCTKGCAACCNFIVFLEASEVQLIVDRHPKQVARAIPTLRRQQKRMYEVISQDDMRATLLRGDQAALQRVAGAWADLYEPCALLDRETKLCTVYESRPHPCRTYFVVSDPVDCSVAHGRARVLDVGASRVVGHSILLATVAKERGGELRMGNFVDLMIEFWDKRNQGGP